MLNYELIDNKLQLEYREKFECRITYSYPDCVDVVGTPGNIFEIREATEEKINELMQESISSGKNKLLEFFRDCKITEKLKTNCDY